MNFNLIVSPQNDEPTQYELIAKRIGIGREADNQITIPLETVSSAHCEIRLEDEDWFIEDIGSKNGTRVNGRAVLEPLKLQDGDRILIGETVPCHFVALADDEEYEDAVASGGDPEAVSKYVKLNEKLQELEKDIISKTLEAETLEGHLERLRDQFSEKKVEYDQLFTNIKDLQKQIETSADPSKIDELEKDLVEKTRRITLLKSDIAGTEAQIDDLEQTKRTAVRVPNPKPPSSLPAPSVPTAPATPAVPASKLIVKPSVPVISSRKPGEIPLAVPPIKVGPAKPKDL